MNFSEAMREILAVSSLGNQYFQSNGPWKLIKEDKERTQRICGFALNIIKNLSILIAPVLPSISAELGRQLNVKSLQWGDIDFTLKNHAIGKEKILVQKMEEKEGEKFPLNLKTAKILSVEDHPDADRLYVLKIDLGQERRELVAGLKGHYTKEEVLGKNVGGNTNVK